jgi:hypothetical protein
MEIGPSQLSLSGLVLIILPTNNILPGDLLFIPVRAFGQVMEEMRT